MIISSNKSIKNLKPILSAEETSGFTTDQKTGNFCYITKTKGSDGIFTLPNILNVFDINCNLITEMTQIPGYINLSIVDIDSFVDSKIVLKCEGILSNEQQEDDEDITISNDNIYTIISMNGQCLVKPGNFKSIKLVHNNKFIAKIDNVDADSDVLKKLKSIDMENTVCLFDLNETMLVDFTDYEHVDTINNTDQLFIVSKKDTNPKNFSNKVHNLCNLEGTLLLPERIERISANYEGTRLILGGIKDDKGNIVWKFIDIGLNDISLKDENDQPFIYDQFDFQITFRGLGTYKNRKLGTTGIYDNTGKIILDSDKSNYTDIDPYSGEFFGAWKKGNGVSFGSGAFFGPQTVSFIYGMIDSNGKEITPFVFKSGMDTLGGCFGMECLDVPEVILDGRLETIGNNKIIKDEKNKAIFSPDGRQLLTLQRKLELISKNGKNFQLSSILLDKDTQNIIFDDFRGNIDIYNKDDFILDIDLDRNTKGVIEVNGTKRYSSGLDIDITVIDSELDLDKICDKVEFENERYITFGRKKYLKKVLNI